MGWAADLLHLVFDGIDHAPACAGALPGRMILATPFATSCEFV